MAFLAADFQNLARALHGIAPDAERERVDAFLERREQLRYSELDQEPGVCRLREEGYAVRRIDAGGHEHRASGDGFDVDGLERALRQVAPRLPAEPVALGRIESLPFEGDDARAPLYDFPARLRRSIEASRVGFPVRVTIEHHRRWLRVLGPHLGTADESESYFGCRIDHPWGRFGTLLVELDEPAVQGVAERAVASFLARDRLPPSRGRRTLLLGPDAAAVLLHEAVAHTLEADLLALTGRPESALGRPLGAALLDVVDDPGSAPAAVARRFDDEGSPVVRRWLLRQGRVEQLLADECWTRRCDGLMPGAARRASRHDPLSPRSTHLELLAGDVGEEELLADLRSGLFAPWASGGRLDPVAGRFTLELPFARVVDRGRPGERVGPFRVTGSVPRLLHSVIGVARERRRCAAGWCAKGGQKLPVWATAPALLIADAEVEA